MNSTNTSRTIFMTGAAGYIGSRITAFAIEKGYKVIGLSRSEISDETLRNLGAESVRGDLTSLDILTEQSSKADHVIHLADAWKGNLDKPYSWVVKTDNAVIDAIAEGIKGTNKRLIVTSGSLVVEADPDGKETDEESPLLKHPLNDRIGCEQYAMNLAKTGVNVCALRLAPFVYGNGGSGVRLFMARGLQAGGITCISDVEACNSSIHVDDAARLYLATLENGKAGEVYNATSETDVTNHQLAKAMSETLGTPIAWMAYAEAEGKLGKFFAGFLSAANRASNAKARRELLWTPREVGILEDTTAGSYVSVAKALNEAQA